MTDLNQTTVFWTIVGMGIVTYLPRLLPLLILSGQNGARDALPPWVARWLGYVPAAVLSSD